MVLDVIPSFLKKNKWKILLEIRIDEKQSILSIRVVLVKY